MIQAFHRDVGKLLNMKAANLLSEVRGKSVKQPNTADCFTLGKLRQLSRLVTEGFIAVVALHSGLRTQCSKGSCGSNK